MYLTVPGSAVNAENIFLHYADKDKLANLLILLI